MLFRSIVAAASFSASRPLPRRVDSPYENVPKEYHSLYELVTVNSYEWLRFAILPGVRVVGGMSKILASFINDIKSNAPFEIMSYSDNEWSNGSGYEKLGFKYVNEKIPVLYYIDKNSFNRYSQYQLNKLPFAKEEDYYRIENKGSKKYILKKW